jgi:hypothetical protein
MIRQQMEPSPFCPGLMMTESKFIALKRHLLPPKTGIAQCVFAKASSSKLWDKMMFCIQIV